jgi:hypothetical protein
MKPYTVWHAGARFQAAPLRWQAFLAMADYVECEADIKRALAEDPRNVGVRLLQKEYKQKVGVAPLLHGNLAAARCTPHTLRLAHPQAAARSCTRPACGELGLPATSMVR